MTQTTLAGLDIRVVALDFGGVLRDSSEGLDAGYRAGFSHYDVPYRYRPVDTWHLRGIGKFDIGIECIKALLALELSGQAHDLGAIIERPDAEPYIDSVVSNHEDEPFLALAERIRLKYKEFFNSPAAGELIRIYDGAQDAVVTMSGKGYLVALLTNGNRVTVDRDLSFPTLFDLILSEDDVREKKPSGDGLVIIANTFNVDVANVIFVCDAPNDIRAAKKAGTRSAAVLSGMGRRTDIVGEHPDLIVEDLDEFARVLPPLYQPVLP